MFAFSSSEPLLLSDGTCSSGICTPSNIGFPLKSGSIVVALEVISSKFLRFLTQIALFWPSM